MTRQLRGLSLVPLMSVIFIVGAILLTAAEPLYAQRFATGQSYKTPAGRSPTVEMLRDVGIDQKLGDKLPLDADFVDESGSSVRLGDFFRDKPVILVLVQYECPMLCTQVLNGLLKSSQAIPQQIGRDFDVVTVSFDARETPDLAAKKRRNFAVTYHRPGADVGLHFLTGTQSSIDRLTQAVGFNYRYDTRSNQFAHPSGIMIATPDGKLSRYFYGIEYSPHDLRLGLAESASERIGSPVDRVLLLCYHYDPLTGRYGLAISGALHVAGIATVLLIGAFLVVMIRTETRRPKFCRGPDGSVIVAGASFNQEPS